MTTPGHPPAPAPPAPARDLTGVTLRTERLILRAWAEADVEAITEACQDPQIQRYVPVPVPYTRADAETFVRVTAPHIRATGSGAIFGVFASAAGEAVGSIGLHDLSRLDRPYGGAGEIGYWTAPGARGRGYMTEAVREVCRWGFEDSPGSSGSRSPETRAPGAWRGRPGSLSRERCAPEPSTVACGKTRG